MLAAVAAAIGAVASEEGRFSSLLGEGVAVARAFVTKLCRQLCRLTSAAVGAGTGGGDSDSGSRSGSGAGSSFSGSEDSSAVDFSFVPAVSR